MVDQYCRGLKDGSDYRESINSMLLGECKIALERMMACTTLDKSKCAPNDEDFVLCERVLEKIKEYEAEHE
jgi:hypothetical protein